jgi:hypothetical protein
MSAFPQVGKIKNVLLAKNIKQQEFIEDLHRPPPCEGLAFSMLFSMNKKSQCQL